MTKATAKPELALTVIPPNQYAAMQFDVVELAEVVQDNLGGQELKVADLPAITLPLGGATTWSIPTMDGDEETENLDGIIVYHKQARAYWPGAYDGASTPPTCRSDDGLVGEGNPGGPCRACPLSQFSIDGGRPECRSRIDVFILRPTMLLPYVLRLPPTSFKAFNTYMKGLTFAGQRGSGIITRFTLGRVKKDKLTFGVVQPQTLTRLDKAESATMRGYVDAITPLLRAPIAAMASARAFEQGGSDDDLDGRAPWND